MPKNEKARPDGLAAGDGRGSTALAAADGANLSIDEDEERLSRARQLIGDALRLIENHPRAWAFVCERAAADYRAGRRLSMQRYWELAREKAWTGNDGGEFKLNNDLCAPLARILVARNPQYRQRIELRHSLIDEVGVDGAR